MIYQLNAYPIMGALDVMCTYHHSEPGAREWRRLGSDLLTPPWLAEATMADVVSLLGTWLQGLGEELANERPPF